jgi:nucleolar GTP-binding protein
MFRLPYVPLSQDLVDRAFRAGAKSAKMSRGRGAKVSEKVLTGEIRRVEVMSSVIEGELNAVVNQFPVYDGLSEFQRRLLDLKVDKDRYKKSLATLKWCSERVVSVRNKTLRKLKTQKDTGISRQFMGRASSFIKRIEPELRYLAEAKKTIMRFPPIREGIPTLVVAGIPNAGKSTFTSALTGSKIKVAPYPFTTVEIMVGYKKVRYLDYQIIDSPGILDRPMSERNSVELSAILALQYLATSILYLIDNTQDFPPQENLLREIQENFHLPVHVFVNDKGGSFNAPYPVFDARDESKCEEIMKKCLAIS